VVSSTHCRTLHPGKTQYPFYRRLGGPQRQSGQAEYLVHPRDSIPDRPARSSVAIPTELPGPLLFNNSITNFVLPENSSLFSKVGMVMRTRLTVTSYVNCLLLCTRLDCITNEDSGIRCSVLYVCCNKNTGQ